MCKVCHEPLLQIDSLLENLHRNERTGNKPRCHWLTHGAPGQVASRLNALAEPWGSVSVDDLWMPEGFSRIQEAQLDKTGRLLPKQDRDRLRRWWLAVSRRNTRTPTWDIASTCTVDGHKGLLLIEAKAHTQELKVQDPVEASLRNRERIAECIEEANAALADWTGLYWALSHEHGYQMANRFAWSWKLTELGYPVILVYLGFLRAEEMRKGREKAPYKNHAEWEGLVKVHSEPLFPAGVWGGQWVIHGRPFVPRICSIRTRYDGPMEEEWRVGREWKHPV